MGASAIHHQAQEGQAHCACRTEFSMSDFLSQKTVAGNLSTDPAFMFEPQFGSENLIYRMEESSIGGCQRCFFKMHIQVVDSSLFPLQALV